MVKFVVIIGIIITISCNSSEKIVDNTCYQYYNRIKSNWYKKSEYFYGIKDLETVHKSSKIENFDLQAPYSVESCVKGFSYKKIEKMFGKPTKKIVLEGYKSAMYEYCLSKECLGDLSKNGKKMIIQFKDGVVESLDLYYLNLIETN